MAVAKIGLKSSWAAAALIVLTMFAGRDRHRRHDQKN
jgi:hypothetical protein